MRIWIIAALLGSLAWADEPVAEKDTVRLPADTYIAARFASPARLMEIAKMLEPLLVATKAETRPSEDEIVKALLARQLPYDRDQPIFAAAGKEGNVRISKLKPDAPIPATARKSFVSARDGWIRCASSNAMLDAPNGDKSFAFLPGQDFAFTVPVATIFDAEAELIKEAKANIEANDFDLQLGWPPALKRIRARVIKILVRLTVDAAANTESIHYGLRVHKGSLDINFVWRTKKDSAAQRWLQSLGEPRAHRLLDYLPHETLVSVESGGIGAFLDKALTRTIDEEFGKGSAAQALAWLGASYALAPHLTGDSADVFFAPGMTSNSVGGIHSIRKDAPVAEAIAALDPAPFNKVFKELGVNVNVAFDHKYRTTGGVALHRVRWNTDIPQLAMILSQFGSVFAIHNGKLVQAQGVRAEHTVVNTIARLDSESDRERHPHAALADTVMRRRHGVVVLDLGAIKPFLLLGAMAVPELARVAQHWPRTLPVVFAIAVNDGHLHVRGRIPLQQILDLSVKVADAEAQR